MHILKQTENPAHQAYTHKLGKVNCIDISLSEMRIHLYFGLSFDEEFLEAFGLLKLINILTRDRCGF